MKKLILILSGLFFLALPLGAMAQDVDHSTGQHIKKGAKKAGEGIKKGAKKGAQAVKKGGKVAGHEVAEKASEGAAKITDKKVEGKKGPNGQTIYWDDDKATYYWIDEKGGHVHLSSDQVH